MDLNQKNILSLAYIGDAVFELQIRDYFVKQDNYKVNKLQTLALNYVSAKNQCKFINLLIDSSVLTEEEMNIVKRGRNAKVYSHPKNTDIVTYKWATAFECLFGYLYLKEDFNRINNIMDIIIGE